MIVITGASDGLGKQLAKLYQESGKKVVNISRTKTDFADVNILRDLREGPEIEAAAKEVSTIQESLEAIINCAGVMSGESLGHITEDEVKRLMATNVKSQIMLVSELLSRIQKDETDIVNVSSTVGTKGRPGEPVYAASKWAVRGFTKSLQEDFKNLPNRIISFCPGGFESRTYEKATGKSNSDTFGPVMDPKDLAAMIKSILDLPKNMQVSEIVIDRKKAD